MTRGIACAVIALAACAIPPVDREPGSDPEARDDEPRIRLYPGDDDDEGDAAIANPTATDAGGGATDPGSGGGTPDGAGACGMNAFESEVFQLVNQERSAAGRAAYECHAELGRLARAHSQDMCDRDFSGHQNPDGESPFARIAAAGLTTRTAGENVAAGQTSPSSVMQSWMGSAGHRSNILSGSFESIGVGYASCSTARFSHYWTQVFAAGVQP
jgi:uncharacterized protein YkwD